MNTRDFDYIEARLLAPAVALYEAEERLGALGETELHNMAFEAHQRLNDECRQLRHILTEKHNAELRAARS